MYRSRTLAFGAPDSIRFIAEATGHGYDSLTFRVTLQALSGTTLYTSQWPVATYFTCDPAECEGDTVRAVPPGRLKSIVNSEFAKLLSDSAFSEIPRRFFWDTTYSDAIHDHIATQVWAAQNGISLDSELSKSSLAILRSMPRTVFDSLQVARDEAIRQPAFFLGRADNYSLLVWSPTLKRILEVMAGP